MKQLTDEEILDVATRHCEFTAEGTYHLRKFRGWAIVNVVRDCFELAELCRQAEAAAPGVMAVPAARPPGVHELADVVSNLLQTGRYVDEEGEATAALLDLLKLLTDGAQGRDAAGQICGNCDTAVPPGCSGLFKDDGEACALNRTPGVPEVPHG